MSASYEVFQGGYPVLHTRSKQQRGSGFFSALKRFILPIARRLLPHAAGAVSDLASGKSISDTLKNRAASAGADVIETAAGQGANALRHLVNNSNQPPATTTVDDNDAVDDVPIEQQTSKAANKKYKRDLPKSFSQSSYTPPRKQRRLKKRLWQ